jgi:hypothetical protein
MHIAKEIRLPFIFACVVVRDLLPMVSAARGSGIRSSWRRKYASVIAVTSGLRINDG